MELNYHFDTETFRAAWEEWKIYRKVELKKGYKSILGEQYGLTNLRNVSGADEQTAIKIIHQSMGNRWQGFFPLKVHNTPIAQQGKISTLQATSQGASDLIQQMYGNGTN